MTVAKEERSTLCRMVKEGLAREVKSELNLNHMKTQKRRSKGPKSRMNLCILEDHS